MPGLEAAGREERSPKAAAAGRLLFWMHDCSPRCCGKVEADDAAWHLCSVKFPVESDMQFGCFL